MKLLLAVSGGIDSMYMANRALDSALFSYEASFSVAHCNFHLRDEESDADREFVRHWCEENGVEFLSEDFDTSGYAKKKNISVEMAARELRYAWFSKLCQEHGFEATVVAHNSDDNAETLLLNMLRGCGSRGMSGMRKDSGVFPSRILRPLLDISRAEIQEYMESHALPWREDRTNKEDIYKRNLLRHKVLPVFKEINPSALRTLSKDMAHIKEVDDIADEYYIHNRGSLHRVESLLGLKHWRYVLYREMQEKGFSEGAFQDLCSLLTSGAQRSGKKFISDRWVLSLGTDAIDFSPKKELDSSSESSCMEVSQPGRYSFGERTFEISLEPARDSLKTRTGEIIASPRSLKFPFFIRNWQEGDWIQPLGLKGKKKISDMMVDLKIPAFEKSTEAVIVSGKEEKEVLSLLTRRISEKIKVCPEADPQIISIKEITT